MGNNIMPKEIMNDVTIYMIMSRRVGIKSNCVRGKYVYLNEEKAEAEKQKYLSTDYDVYIDSINLPFAGKYVSYINIYRGFDYNYGVGIYDVAYRSELYASTELAKQNHSWREVYLRMQQNPDQFNVYDNKICSRDTGGEDWTYGDVMEGNLVAEIKKLKIIR